MNALRMMVVLTVIAALAAGLLAGINAITAPIIAENEEIRLQETLGRVLAADGFEFEIEDPKYSLWTGRKANGDLAGYVVLVHAAGYSSAGITILVGLDPTCEVTGVVIFSHSETPGLGDKVERRSFLQQFKGLGIDSDKQLDAISGATSSSMGVINGVREAIRRAGIFAGLIEDLQINFAEVLDGSYTGEARGFGGTTVVEVTFVDGKLIMLEIKSHSDTQGYFESALATIRKRMLEQQTADVDTVSGATASSNGIINAVKNALAGNRQEPVVISKLLNGKYNGVGESVGGPLEVEITILNGKITQIQVLSHNDTPEYANPAIPVVIDRIIAVQELEVDVYSGATRTSLGIMSAVENALGNEVTIDVSALPDGIYKGTGAGFHGEGSVQVTVVVAGGKITSLDFNHNDTPDYANSGLATMKTRVMEAQSLDVDFASGATASSKGFIQALRRALGSGPLIDVSAIPNGIYKGIGAGFYGEGSVIISITITGGKIIELSSSSDDSPNVAGPALSTLKQRVIDAQSIYVDTVSGATGTSKGFLEALEKALRGAGR
jgi:RnfABCDGE-type electron transport complex G subunit